MTNKLMYFIGNWKMFGDFNSFKIINKINKFNFRNKALSKKIKIILCVPNTLIYPFKKKLKNKFISLGAQNCHYGDVHGPFTGGVSAYMLKKAGTEYIILGHSETRHDGDTNQLIKKKIESSLKQKLKVIFCIGETLKEKLNGKTFSTLKKQLKSSIKRKFNTNNIIIAYEPVWSIGTGRVPKNYDVEKNLKFIKKVFKKIVKKNIHQ